MIKRCRRLLKGFAQAGLGLGVFALFGCGSSSEDSLVSGGATEAPADASANEDCAIIPEETAGPFPGDGSNGPDVLSQSGVVRGDIRSSFGGLSGTAEGIPLTIKLALQDTANGCGPLAGAAVYIWHCDREGRYSLYSDGATDRNYLRGVQETDTDGIATFASIFPACYQGRWPHVHFEVFPSLTSATEVANEIATSQLAFPEDVCNAVYSTEGYGQSVTNLRELGLETDNVFGNDGGIHQLGTVTGSIEEGLVVRLSVPV